MKYFIKLSLSFLIYIILLAIIDGFNNSVIFIVGFVLLVAYWIYSFKSSQKYVSKEEFLNMTKNYAPSVVVSMLKNRNFSDKEINEMMLKRGTVISLRTNEDALTPAVKKEIDEFNKLDGWKKVDFKNSLPKYYDSSNISWEVEDLEEYTKFCDKHNFSDYSEYEYFKKYINNCLNEDVDKYYQLAKKELKKYDGDNNYADAVSTKVLSVSNKKLKEKLKKNTKELNCYFIIMNYFYFLQNLKDFILMKKVKKMMKNGISQITIVKINIMLIIILQIK